MRRVAEAGKGVIVVLHRPMAAPDVLAAVSAFKQTAQQDPEAHHRPADRRTLGIGAQILRDLGVRRMRLMSAPQRFHGLGGFGLEIAEYVTE